MSCPTCQHTMHNIGLESERTFWCPRCGTLKTYAGDFESVSPPSLPGRVRKAEELSVRASIDGRSLQFAIPSPFWAAACEAAGVRVHAEGKVGVQ